MGGCPPVCFELFVLGFFPLLMQTNHLHTGAQKRFQRSHADGSMQKKLISVMADEALSTKTDQSTKTKSFSIQTLWNS